MYIKKCKDYKLVFVLTLVMLVFDISINVQRAIAQSSICSLVNGTCVEQGKGCPTGTKCRPKESGDGCGCFLIEDFCEEAVLDSKGDLAYCEGTTCPEGYDNCESINFVGIEIEQTCLLCTKTCKCGDYPAGSTWCNGDVVQECVKDRNFLSVRCYPETVQTCDPAKCLTCGGVPLGCVIKCPEDQICVNGKCATPTPTGTPSESSRPF